MTKQEEGGNVGQRESERKAHFELSAFQQGSIHKPAQNVIKPKM